jgi:hypothetical protein
MKSPFRVTLQIAALLVLFVGAVFLGRSLPQPTNAVAAPIAPANAARPLMMGWWSCGAISNVAVFSSPAPGRIHVACSNPPVSGVYYFAFKADDSAMASRMLSIINTALATNKPLWVWWVDVDGSSWGCGYGDCRPITGVEVWGS